MNDFVSFGDPARFEIAARWTSNTEPRERLPQDGGWSTGDIRITVGHQVLTARRHNGEEYRHITWYLAPLLDWLLHQWTWMLHEETYAWPERSGAPAAWAVFAALGRSIASSDETEQAQYRAIQAWWVRHALRAADPSALYPDICLRRRGDDIEISWTGRQPVHAPDGFTLTSPPGYALFEVTAVATPLWQFLEWALQTAPHMTEMDRDALKEMRERFDQLKRTPLKALELRYLSNQAHDLLHSAKATVGLQNTSVLVRNVPAIAELDPAVLMFGGLNPCIGAQDAAELIRFLASHQNGTETKKLATLVNERLSNPALLPYEEGYDLAEEVREEMGVPTEEHDVNVHRILNDLGIKIEEVSLDTDSVRGVAIAGSNFAPAILVNTKSVFNQTRVGRKFTLAHELCHILFDRTRARKLSHVSGPWTAPRIEKRANAFAAMFLASRAATRAVFHEHGKDRTKEAAQALQLGHSAFVEHLYNLGLIDESEREQLRSKADAY
jgi:Zn-dependent peptidase ImmA (M78 family)